MSAVRAASMDATTSKKFEFLQSVLDAIADPILVKDIEHRFIACNQALCQLLGQPRNNIIGHSDPEFLPSEQFEIFWQVDDEVIATGEPHENEEQITDASGNIRTIWTRKFPLRDEQANMIGLCGIITDITMIKERQEEMRRLEK